MAQFVKTKGDAWIGVITDDDEVEWLYAPDDDPDPPDWHAHAEHLELLGNDPKAVAYRIWAEIAAFGGWINQSALDASGCAAELPPPGNVGAVN